MCREMIHMPSFQISISPSRRAAARFVTGVRRKILKALEEEGKKRGLKQTDIARAIGIHRSVINRELRGKKDMTLGRVAELAWAMNREPVFDLPELTVKPGSNLPAPPQTIQAKSSNTQGIKVLDDRKILVGASAAL
jgi:transcriptional regulator with XRE-family HTH domain